VAASLLQQARAAVVPVAPCRRQRPPLQSVLALRSLPAEVLFFRRDLVRSVVT
jgi:hypothetical protein